MQFSKNRAIGFMLRENIIEAAHSGRGAYVWCMTGKPVTDAGLRRVYKQAMEVIRQKRNARIATKVFRGRVHIKSQCNAEYERREAIGQNGRAVPQVSITDMIRKETERTQRMLKKATQ